MKRDMDLIRSIMLEVERLDQGSDGILELEIPGYSDAVVSAHVRMLREAGYVEASDDAILGSDDDHVVYCATRLTWYGHEFLESIRDPVIWRNTKVAAKSIGSAGVKLIGEIASGLLRQKAKELGLDVGGSL